MSGGGKFLSSMRIKQKTIKDEFVKAEKNFNYCWELLIDLKELVLKDNDFTIRLISFQDKLAETIFSLHSIREQIISEEKYTLIKKSEYKLIWFKERMRLLSFYKKGIDQVVNMAKALGDAYAYFFYQFDLNLLEEHLSHQRIINSAAGIGERGEMEFLKRLKHIGGRFILYHGITNILRYGDFSFIDIKKHRIVQLGELKTKQLGQNSLEFKITLLSHKKIKATKEIRPSPKEEINKTRKDRQMLGMIKFLENTREIKDDVNIDIKNQYYFREINELFKNTIIHKTKTIQVSPGLAFSGSKFKKSSLFNKIFLRNLSDVVNKDVDEIPNTIKKILKPNSNDNSIIMGQLLYNPDFSNKNIPGTIPLFWYPLNLELLRKLYFIEYYIISFLNPIHLIDDIQNLGFFVESKYSSNKDTSKAKHAIQRFDLFISYIINCLQTESFVIDCITEVTNHPFENTPRRVLIKPQQYIPTHG